MHTAEGPAIFALNGDAAPARAAPAVAPAGTGPPIASLRIAGIANAGDKDVVSADIELGATSTNPMESIDVPSDIVLLVTGNGESAGRTGAPLPRPWASRPREISPACSSTLKCREIAGRLMANGSASSLTVASPLASCCWMAPRKVRKMSGLARRCAFRALVK